MSSKLTTAIVIDRFVKKWNNRFDYSLVDYKNADTKIKIICQEHGIFELMAWQHKKGVGCYKCGRISAGIKNKIKNKSNIQEFIKKSKKIFDNEYDYTDTVYTHSHDKITIICKKHGKFITQASRHLEGQGCQQCSEIIRRNKLKQFETHIDMINLFNIVHDNKYDYSLINQYTNYKQEIKIICKTHGIFKKRIDTHYNGGGCIKCFYKDKLISTEEYIKQVEIIHNYKYNYSKTEYNGCVEKIIIICPKHGEFYQEANSHKMGTGCPSCRYRISKPATEWFNSLNDKNIILEQKINDKFVDGYNPITNTVYEFNGDYWHGNPEIFDRSVYNKRTKCTMGELYDNTIKKELMLINAGYNVITMWERDWKKIKLKSDP